MAAPTKQKVTLNVRLGGSIAYVPESDNSLWALMPNGLLPAPAGWGKAKDDSFYARSPHMPFMVVDRKFISNGTSEDSFKAIVRKFRSTEKAAETEYAVALLIGQQLEFDVGEGKVALVGGLKEFPHMKKISESHSLVARRFHPTPASFPPADLSAVLQLRGGSLKVNRYFGGSAPLPLDFGYVYPLFNELRYGGRKKFARIANELLWTIVLPDNKDKVTITSREKNTGDRKYILEASRSSNSIDIQILHSEAEAPSLFLEDPPKPEETNALPDPDFELMYSLSSYEGDILPWLVPIPDTAGGGAIEKPCTGGFFGGFSG